jgi:alpha-beta hydrolase superfamily lysophospholipase
MIWWTFALVLLSLILWIAFRPVLINEIESHSEPAASYQEAITHVKAMQEADRQDHSWDVCITKLYDHGIATDHVIVLLHGFTTCPQQFDELGKQYFEAGFNVLIPRIPYHGLSDRMTNALLNLTAKNLAAFGDQVINIAHGLGKQVSVMGISGSGTLICWLAQNRTDLDFAIPIAPLLGLAFIPSALTKMFERFALLLPNFFMWWDPRTKADNPYSIYYAYPGYPTRALVEILHLGMITRAQAERLPAAAKNIVMVINDAEPAVSNAEALKLLKVWQKHGKGNLSEVHFEKDMKLPHDIITPGTPNLPIEEIHPRLIRAVKDVHARPEKHEVKLT